MAKVQTGQSQVAENSEQISTRVIGKPFRPGESGNPGGRPKSKWISDYLKQVLASGDGDLLGQTLRDIAKGQLKPKPGQLQALDMVMDRTEGKPVQAHKVEAGVDQATASIVAELLAKLK